MGTAFGFWGVAGWGPGRYGCHLAFLLRVGKKAGEESQQGQVGAEVEDMVDAGAIGQPAQDGGADATHAEGETEKESGDESDLAGHEFLGIDEDSREGGGEDHADEDGEDSGPE